MERRVSQRARMLTTQLDAIAQQSSQKLDAAVDSARNVLASISSQLQILHRTSEDLNFAMADSLEQMKMVSSLLSDVDENTGE
jgi:ribosome-binding factor A